MGAHDLLEQRARTRNEVCCCVEPDFGSEGFVFVLREAHELPVTAGGWVRSGAAGRLRVLVERCAHEYRFSEADGCVERTTVLTLGVFLPPRLVLPKNRVPPRGEINLGHAR